MTAQSKTKNLYYCVPSETQLSNGEALSIAFRKTLRDYPEPDKVVWQRLQKRYVGLSFQQNCGTVYKLWHELGFES